MRLVAKIPVSDDSAKEEIINQIIESDDIKPKSIRGGLIVDLTFKINEWVDIPQCVLNHENVLLINVAEKGGNCDGVSYAQVVCGISGKPLKPFFLPRKNVSNCGDHAYFTLPERCFTIEASMDYENMVKIKEHTIESNLEIRKARILTDEVYSGLISELPEDLIRFKKPSQVCLDKCQCDDCINVFYYVDPNNIKFQQHSKRRNVDDALQEELQEAA